MAQLFSKNGIISFETMGKTFCILFVLHSHLHMNTNREDNEASSYEKI